MTLEGELEKRSRSHEEFAHRTQGLVQELVKNQSTRDDRELRMKVANDRCMILDLGIGPPSASLTKYTSCSFRLGRFSVQRMSSQYGEYWEDGQEMREIKRRQAELLSRQEKGKRGS